MTERTNSSNHRLAAIQGSKSNDRYYPLRTNVSPGFTRSSSSVPGSFPSSLSPQGPPEGFHDMMTIRAVLPDSDEGDIEDDTDDSLTAQHSPNTPPRTPRTPSRSTDRSNSRLDMLGRESPESTSPKKSRPVSTRPPLSNFSQFADLSISRAKSRSPTERTFVTSPSSDERPTTTETASSTSSSHASRQRYAPPTIHQPLPPMPISVGYPSTQSPPPVITKPSSRPSRQRFLRPQQSISSLSSYKTTIEQGPVSPVSTTDANTLLKLMKDLRGRMEGSVEYRIGDNMIWSKGFCVIKDTGSLIHKRENGSNAPSLVIIQDLRGCQVRATGLSPKENDGIIEITTHSSKTDVKLRPLIPQQYNPWLAALLYWQALKPAGTQIVKSSPQQRRDYTKRRNSDATLSREAAIIKVGKMLLWRWGGPTSLAPHAHSSGKGHNRTKIPQVAWQRISCTLQDSGEFRLYAEMDTTLLTVIQLNRLSRFAIQQLDPSILGQDFCIAIYPQYSAVKPVAFPASPLYLSVDGRVLYEVWFVLLRAYAMPEIYGPANNAMLGSLTDSYRIQRSLFMRIIEAKVTIPGSENNHREKERDKENLDYYAEVKLDGQVRAKTMVRTKTHNPFWREDYEFPDLPTVLAEVDVVLKQRDPRWKTRGSGTVNGSNGFGGGLGGASAPGGRDTVIGRVEIQLELDDQCEKEGWWPLISTKGTEEKVGEMFLKLELEELVVLMSEEYRSLSELLHEFKNGITMELGQVIAPDLRRLAETLLKVYQVNGKASDWLMSLAEGEIDGLHKEKPSRIALRHRGSNESADFPDHERHDVIRAALGDANILFRGNSLLTKALDAHMKRLGREYLEETLGEHLQRIADEDTYCEVDPMRLENQEHLSKNWKMLLSHTRVIWQAIYLSPQRCPLELRRILRHIRTCVEDRYGEILRTVSYSSVCGFLFLRFFCPAILNPKLFGLLKDHPGVRAQRTLTLIAKSLQGLANNTTFGVKEPWMESMNEFLTEHSAELRDFVDSITTVPPSQYCQPAVPPSYATPIAILNRVPAPCKEGFPSLPYLIDQPRAFAALVAMWLKWYPIHVKKNPGYHLEGTLAKFHELCHDIQKRVHDCVEKAENAERPDSSLSSRWEEVAEKATSSPFFGPGQSPPPLMPHTSASNYAPSKGHKVVGLDEGYFGNFHQGYGYGTTKKGLSGFVGGFRRKVRSRALVSGDDE